MLVNMFIGRPAGSYDRILDFSTAVVGGPGPDRFVAPDLEAACELVSSGKLVAAAEGAVGELA